MPVCCLRLKECLFRFQVFRANEDVKSVGWWRQQKFLLSCILIPASHHLQCILIWKFTIDRDQNNVLFSYLEKNKEIIRKLNLLVKTPIYCTMVDFFQWAIESLEVMRHTIVWEAIRILSFGLFGHCYDKAHFNELYYKIVKLIIHSQERNW